MSSILFCTASPLAANDLGDLATCCIARDAGCCMLLAFTADKQQQQNKYSVPAKSKCHDN